MLYMEETTKDNSTLYRRNFDMCKILSQTFREKIQNQSAIFSRRIYNENTRHYLRL